jgi:hypothetical protein
MSKGIEPKDLGDAIKKELTIYSSSVTEKINNVARAAVEKLVQLTKQTAPKGKRKSKKFANSITYKETVKDRGNEYTWYVKAPNHRLTHLLVHGHATKDGGRTKADPFLSNALDEVLPEFEHQVEEAVKND